MTPFLSTAILRAQSDERLVALAGDGHERAFEALIERYRKPLLRHVRRLLPEARAEDALQQAFLNAWSALERGVEIREPRAWLYRVAQNAALNALRSPGYDYAELRDSLRSPHAGPHDDHERRWVIRRTLASVAALPENQREALLRTAVEGRSQEQVATELGLSEGAVRGLVHRARTTLRAAVTAVTPSPLIGWAVALASGGGPGSAAERIAQVAAGGGSAGVGAALAKASAVVAVTGVLATGAVTVHDQSGGRGGGERADAETIGPHANRSTAAPAVAGTPAAGAASGTASAESRSSRPGRRGGNHPGQSGRDHGRFGEHGRGNPQHGHGDIGESHGHSGDKPASPGEDPHSSGSGKDGGGRPAEHSGAGSGSSGSNSGSDGGGSSSGTDGGSGSSGTGDSSSGSGSSGDGGGSTSSSDGHDGSGSSGPGSGTVTTSGSGDGSGDSGSRDHTTTDTVTAPTS